MPYAVISSILFIVGIIIVTWLHSQYQLDIVVKPVHPLEDAPLVSVCIPAFSPELVNREK